MNNCPMKGHGYIYKYTSPSGKSYVGQTVKTLEERAKSGKGYINCKVFWQAIQKYGWNAFEVTILGEFPIAQLDNMEKRYIEIYNTKVPYGYNILEGGSSPNNKKKVYQYDPDTGYLLKEHESVQSAADSVNVTIATMSNCLNDGHPRSKDFFWSFQKLERYPVREVTSTHEKTVFMYDLNDNLIETFKSISKAAEFVQGERSAIKRCCRGELRSAYNYKWKCDEAVHEKKYSNKARPIHQLDINTGEIIQTYPSISSAMRAFEKSGTTLFRKALNNPKYTAYGYRWEYA